MRKKIITIGIPCYNEEKNINYAYREIINVISKIKNFDFQILFTDNGSSDKTRLKIKELAKKDKRISGIFLSRNFGPESSGQALLDLASGDAFIFLPCDLEDPPDKIPDFIKKWEEGFDVVIGVYSKSGDSPITSFFRKNFYTLFKAISEINIPVNAGAFGLIDKKVVLEINKLPEKYRFFRGLRAWVGFKTTIVRYHRNKRKYGKSSYSFINYFKHAERGIFGFSYLPIDIIAYLGFLMPIMSISILIVVSILYFLGIKTPQSLILILILILINILLLGIGVIGKYLQVIVEEAKARPVYIIEEIIGPLKNNLK